MAKTSKRSSKSPKKLNLQKFFVGLVHSKFILFLVVAAAVAAGLVIFKANAATNDTILYVEKRPGLPTALVIKFADGSRHELRSDLPYDSLKSAVFGRDENTILYHNASQIYIFDVTTGNARLLTESSEVQANPRVSPDGNTVTFGQLNHDANSTWSLYSVQLDGTGLKALTQPGQNVGAASWSPDGTRLAYVQYGSPTNDITQIWSVRSSDGGDPRLISEAAGNPLGMPEWSPDGQFLFYRKDGRIAATNFSGKTVDTGKFNIGRIAIANNWNTYFTYPSGISDPNTGDDVNRIWRMFLGDFSKEDTNVDESNGYSVELADVLKTGAVGPAPSAFLDKFGPTTGTCPPAKLFGVRGTDQKASDNAGFGPIIWSVVEAFRQEIPSAITTPIQYPALGPALGVELGVYKDSERDGEKNLGIAFVEFRTQCPNTPIVLAGYSQGAHIVGNYYESLDPTVRSQVAALLMFADPRFNSQQDFQNKEAMKNESYVNFGTFNRSRNGFIAYMSIPFKEQARTFGGTMPGDFVHSYCLKKDIVCNFNVKGTVLNVISLWNTHTEYDDKGWTGDGGRWAADRANAWRP